MHLALTYFGFVLEALTELEACIFSSCCIIYIENLHIITATTAVEVTLTN
jgi:hypothetical protein